MRGIQMVTSVCSSLGGELELELPARVQRSRLLDRRGCGVLGLKELVICAPTTLLVYLRGYK